MSVYPRHKRREALGVVFVASSLLLVLSLVSYAPFDPSLNVSGPAADYHNYAGKFGAWTADLFLQLVGLPAFALPLAALWLGFLYLRSLPVDYPWVKLLGGVVSLGALCAGLHLTAATGALPLEYEPGGVLGILLGGLLLSYFNTAGSLVVVAAVLLVSLVLTTRFSFEAVLDWASGKQFDPIGRVRNGYRDWREQRRERREVASLRNQERRVLTATPPRKVVLAPDSGGTAARIKSSDSPPRSDWPPPVEWPQPGEHAEGIPDEAQAQAKRPFRLPSLDFLQHAAADLDVDEAELIQRAEKLTAKYSEFDVNGRVLQIHPGPVVTTFEFKPDAGIKYTRITNLSEDLCLALKAESIRIDRIPGKNTVGIEVPNAQRQTIYLRESLSSVAFQQSPSLLTLGLGMLINGNTFVSDLSAMPHLLIAGATGSGKSVAINCLICSILYKATPEQVRFIMIDPKRLELGLYADIPHLLTPIVTDPKQASNALNWAVKQMEERYKLLAAQGVRNITQYNRLIDKLPEPAEGEEPLEKLPLIVVVVDELADLMMTAGKEVEASLTRLAQMARAIGIHLILATQRPSVDVITGLIKANFPSRISFRVSSKIDSRTVLDGNGAEQLLGQGDMLFLSPRTSRPMRLHGGLVTEKEIASICDFLREQGTPSYREEILESEEEDRESALVDIEELDDPLYDEAARFVVETGKASTSLLQRRLRIGYGRAARLLDMMEHEGIVGPPDGSKPRELRVPQNYFDEIEN